jgi:hypothetical protein
MSVAVASACLDSRSDTRLDRPVAQANISGVLSAHSATTQFRSTTEALLGLVE